MDKHKMKLKGAAATTAGDEVVTSEYAITSDELQNIINGSPEVDLRQHEAIAEELKKKIENGEMTANQARSILGIDPVDEPNANRKLKKV